MAASSFGKLENGMEGVSTHSSLGMVLTSSDATAVCLATACVSTAVFPSSAADITDGADVASWRHEKLENGMEVCGAHTVGGSA